MFCDHDPSSSTRQTCHRHLQFGPSIAGITVSIPTFSQLHQIFLSYATLIPTVLIGSPRQNKKKGNANVQLSHCTFLWLIFLDDFLDSNSWCSLVFPVTDDYAFPDQDCSLLEWNRALQPAADLLHSWCSAWKIFLSLIPSRGLGRTGPDQIQKGPHASRVGLVDVVGGFLVVRACMRDGHQKISCCALLSSPAHWGHTGDFSDAVEVSGQKLAWWRWWRWVEKFCSPALIAGNSHELRPVLSWATVMQWL